MTTITYEEFERVKEDYDKDGDISDIPGFEESETFYFKKRLHK